MRLVDFRLKSGLGTSGAEIVRKMMFFSGSLADERWAHSTERYCSAMFAEMAWFGLEQAQFALMLTFRYCGRG